MNLVKTSNRWLNRLYKTLAILLVLVAVFTSTLRLLLPYVENYKTHLEDYLNSNNNTQISIGSLAMSWRNLGPILVIKNVQLLDTEQAYVFIEELDLQVDFWKSITRQQLISERLILKGAKIFIDEGLWNTIEDKPNTNTNTNTTAGSNLSDPTQKPTEQADSFAFAQVANLFLNRISTFSILDSEINIGDEKGRRFKIVRIRWHNEGDTHKAQGRVILDDLSDTQVKVSIDLKGDTAQSLMGKVYLHAKQLDITPWLKQYLAVNNDNSSSSISFDAWARIRNSEVDRLQVDLYDNEVSWNSPSRQQIKLSPAQLLLVQNKSTEGFTLYSTPFSLSVNDYQATPFKLFMKKKKHEVTGYISTLDMVVASEILPLFVKDKALKQVFSTLSLSGTVDDIFILNQAEHFVVDAKMTGISSDYSGGIPGVKNVSGHLNFHNNKLLVDISSENGVIDLQDQFVLPIPYNTLAMKSVFDFSEQGWELTIKDIAISSPELTLSGGMKIEAPNNGETKMSLLMGIVKGDASVAEHYYPLNLMSESLFNYLDVALVEGDLTQANVLFNGPLSHFPFEDDAGVFVVDAEIEDGIFQFADGWAPITEFTANLNFTNEGMMITGRNGHLANINIKGVEVGIADLGNEQILTVDALIKPVEAHELTTLLKRSPYESSVGAALEILNIGGEVNGDFNLVLPLNDNSQAVATGEINFKDNSLRLQKPRVDFTNLNGKLAFSNDKITTQALTLDYSNLPLTLEVNGLDKENYYDTSIKFAGKWQEKSWLEKVPQRLKRYVKGKLNWQGELGLHHHKNGGFSYTADINSTLKGIALDLPVPYKKSASNDMPLTIKSRGGIAQSTIDFKVGEELNFFGELKHDTTSFSKAHLVIGNDAMLLPMDGFHITTKLEKADVGEWFPLINDIITSVNTPSINAPSVKTTAKVALSKNAELPEKEINTVESLPLLSSPERVRGSVGELLVLGKTLHNSSFNLLDKKQWWLLQLNAKETRSRIKIFPDWETQGLAINADFIHIINEQPKVLDTVIVTHDAKENVKHTSETELVSETTQVNLQGNFDNIPKINFYCARCQVNALRLGEVKFDLERKNENQLEINTFSATRGDASLNIVGKWQLKEGVSKTNLEGSISIDSIEHEFNALSLGSIIRDSGAKLNFDLNWDDAPSQFSMERLNGDLDIVIDDGYLAQVPDTARIFSVLSLESLLRKLTLDFRDIFSDGMFYSSIKGNYDLKQGILHTDNTKLNGTAGDLIITGSTDLSQGLLDYKMSYKPNLTSSLPVLAWIATSLNPATFLAGIALDQIITANVVSEFNFELKGPIDDPQLTEIDRKSKNVSVDSKNEGKTIEQSPPATIKPKQDNGV